MKFPCMKMKFSLHENKTFLHEDKVFHAENENFLCIKFCTAQFSIIISVAEKSSQGPQSSLYSETCETLDKSSFLFKIRVGANKA